ncbi:MAG: RsmB/NOP family class I SAM-dependent RNA methyltransferase [Bacteroidetes bacterium]|nr:RsmB/NOP family class I SAM-dependent RNA methyltransferase [Bacteroidota bacterium]
MTPTPDDFPTAFVDRYRDLLAPDVWERIVDGMSAERQTWFRLNPLRGGNWADLDALGLIYHKYISWEDAGWVDPDHREALLASAPAQEGKIYVQGLSSQLPVRVLEPQGGVRLLDLAAAPGSKTLQLAAMAPEADIAAVEIVRKRKFRLEDNLERNGASNVKVFLQDGTKVWRYRPEHFDRILLDAPCSSEGRFRFDEPQSYGFWNRSKTKEMVRTQRRLVFSAIHALAPGGTLVYSTCSLAPEENEGIVAHILEAFGYCLDIEPVTFDVPERVDALLDWGKGPVDPRIAACCRLLPSERMEGFFVARFRKGASSDPPIRIQRR